MSENHISNVVLVHGAFVDGSGWERVYHMLTGKGYRVSVVQHATKTLGEDVAFAKRAIAALDGPVVLVGHSYGGVVITEAGNHPKVSALVYVAAFAPDEGESVSSIIANPPPGAPVAPILPPRDGLLFLDRDKFAASFAADLPLRQAAFMADAQLPWGVAAVASPVNEPAWKTKPSWFLVAADDRMIPPAAQRFMAERAGAEITETAGSHVVFMSRPEVVVEIVERAAAGAMAGVR